MNEIHRWRAFAVVAVAFFMTIVDLTIVNVALPTIGRKLHFSETRSEEHTSELQSRGHLVCRLLLEKKKQKRRSRAHSKPGRCASRDRRAASGELPWSLPGA